jgi:hypothetical protein
MAKSVYVHQMRAWLSAIPRSQFLVMRMESFFEDQVAGMQRILDFVGESTLSDDTGCQLGIARTLAGVNATTRVHANAAQADPKKFPLLQTIPPPEHPVWAELRSSFDDYNRQLNDLLEQDLF